MTWVQRARTHTNREYKYTLNNIKPYAGRQTCRRTPEVKSYSVHIYTNTKQNREQGCAQLVN